MTRAHELVVALLGLLPLVACEETTRVRLITPADAYAIALAAPAPASGIAGDSTQLAFRVTTSEGLPVPGAMVSVGAHAPGGYADPTGAFTDTSGRASVEWHFATRTGSETLSVDVPNVPKLSIPLEVSSAAPASLVVESAPDSGDVGASVSPAIRLLDRYGNGVADSLVSAVVVSGDGTATSGVRTDAEGRARLTWTLGGAAWQQQLAVMTGAVPAVTLTVGVRAPTSRPTVRIILFGDSNTEWGIKDTTIVEWSYLDYSPFHLSPAGPFGPHGLAGKVEAASPPAFTFHAINHALAGATTGNDVGVPSARFVWEGVTRFDAEVLGLAGTTWHGGTGVPRVNAIVPTSKDFVYVSLGTNDWSSYQIEPASTIDNLAWMADRWISAGLPASHFIITTLPPVYGRKLQTLNPLVRQLATAKGLSLIDLSAYTSRDDGETWKPGSFDVDGIHYAEKVRDWLATAIVEAAVRVQ